MAATNKTKVKNKTIVDRDNRLAGGFGVYAAKQPDELALRRMVLTCLLWEDAAYMDGVAIAEEITKLIPKVHPEAVAALAIEARLQQKLRHIPLFLCRQMAKLDTHKTYVAKTLGLVIRRPDEMTEFLSLYWKDNGGKKTLSAQVKNGLGEAFKKFNEYQLAKWDRDDKEVKLRDVLFLTHSKPKDQAQELLYKKLVDKKLAIPDTWEVGLSAAKTKEEKKFVWETLLREENLGAFAFLKNLRNIREAEVDRKLVADSLLKIKPDMLLPLDFFKAAKYAPEWMRELETVMLTCCKEYPKLPGFSVFVIDVSGSMGAKISEKSEFNRMEAGAAMAVLAAEMSEHVAIYATAGSDSSRVHATERLKPYRGFALTQEIGNAHQRLSGGGIFTRQCLDYIKTQEKEQPDRIIVFSDSQDCDHPGSGLSNPFGKHNYIVDVSPHKNGVNYKGRWTAEISGWSGAFLNFIAACEQMELN